MQASDRLIAKIKELEGFIPVAKHLSIDRPGVFTIGYGETNGIQDGMTITEPEADTLLRARVQGFASRVESALDVPVSQGQFDALVDFAYNCGFGNLKTSTLLRKLNQRDYTGASKEFSRWTMANGKVLPGLVARRQLETEWFLEVA